MTRCAVEGCERPAHKAVLAPMHKGMKETPLCSVHLREWRRWLALIYGVSPEVPLMGSGGSPPCIMH